MIGPAKQRLRLECLLLFGGAPLAVHFLIEPAVWPYLLAGAALLGAAFEWPEWLRPPAPTERAILPRLLGRFAACACLLLVVVAALAPDRLFLMPRQTPALWAALLLSYPLLSVYPQELVYRSLFYRRYRALFPHPVHWLAASAGAFAWLHVVFGNLLAPALCLVGGWFFAQTYRASGSLRLVVLEHSLYGALVFTIGIGEFFYHGAVTA